MGLNLIDIGLELPVVVMDDDFIEFLQEESVFDTIELVELAELFKLWMDNNCEQ